MKVQITNSIAHSVGALSSSSFQISDLERFTSQSFTHICQEEKTPTIAPVRPGLNITWNSIITFVLHHCISMPVILAVNLLPFYRFQFMFNIEILIYDADRRR